MEEVIEEVIVGTLHRKMVVMSGPQYIICPHEQNVFLDGESFSKHNQRGLGIYDSNEARSLPMNF